jgi:hypothetical protein
LSCEGELRDMHALHMHAEQLSRTAVRARGDRSGKKIAAGTPPHTTSTHKQRRSCRRSGRKSAHCCCTHTCMKQHASSSYQQHRKLTRVARRKESTGPQTSLGGGTPDGEEGEQTAQLSRGHTLREQRHKISSFVRKVETFSFRPRTFGITFRFISLCGVHNDHAGTRVQHGRSCGVVGFHSSGIRNHGDGRRDQGRLRVRWARRAERRGVEPTPVS